VTKLWALAVTASSLLPLAQPQTAGIPTPETQFGFRMGADRQLARIDDIEKYFERVASESDRVRITDLGATTEGHRTIAAIISAPENIKNLDAIRRANQRLADPRTLSPADATRLAATAKAVLVIGCSIHPSEIGANQAASELLYTLATATDAATLDVLQNVVVIVIPSLNPDGQRLVVDWYQRTKGTPFEGGAMPWLYHRYAGHDINRDAFMMNLAENRNLARFFYTEWHPQVFLTMHEMQSNGPRFFVPPNEDPIGANYDPLIWRESALLGGSMAFELQRDHHTGVLSNAMFDYYWPGYEDSAPLGHNTVCLLTEVAQVEVASPISVGAADLRAGLKGLPEYKPQINFPEPWPGGRWTLRDIVDYDLSAVHGLLRAVAAYREPIVQSFYDMGRRAVESGRSGGPFAFIIPSEQHDPYATAKLEELLLRGEIEIHRSLEPFRADGDPYPEGTDLILLAQPYRAYVKTLLERQNYPAKRPTPGVPPERPYDAAGWTLGQQMGVEVRTIDRAFEPPAMTRLTKATIASANVWGESKPGFYVVDARGNGGALAINRLTAAGVATSWTTSAIDAGGFRYEPGSLVVPYSKASEAAVARIARDLGLRADGVKGKPPATTRSIGSARVALYKSWVENIDEGWTRWLLEQYEFPFTSIADADVHAGNLRGRFDAIILPSAPSEQLTGGHPSGSMPPEYVGGLGSSGVDALKKFVQAGGTVIALDESGGFATTTFELPLRDVAREAGDTFFCPGSILRLDLDPAQPLAYGMSAQTAAFFSFSSAYEQVATRPAIDGHGGAPTASPIQTIARYGNRDLLLSGWLEGEDVIAGRSAVVRASVGLGHVVIVGFPAQHRAQSHATFRLLFNAIFTARQEASGKS
jgi:hypothetical protein